MGSKPVHAVLGLVLLGGLASSGCQNAPWRSGADATSGQGMMSQNSQNRNNPYGNNAYGNNPSNMAMTGQGSSSSGYPQTFRPNPPMSSSGTSTYSSGGTPADGSSAMTSGYGASRGWASSPRGGNPASPTITNGVPTSGGYTTTTPVSGMAPAAGDPSAAPSGAVPAGYRTPAQGGYQSGGLPAPGGAAAGFSGNPGFSSTTTTTGSSMTISPGDQGGRPAPQAPVVDAPPPAPGGGYYSVPGSNGGAPGRTE